MLQRQLWLISYLKNFGRKTLEEIQRAWEDSSINLDNEVLTRRTFIRTKEAIEANFGLTISNNKRGGGYQYFINESGNWKKELYETLEGNLSMVSLAQHLDYPILKGRILLEHIPSSDRFLQTILNAMAKEHPLRMIYKPYHAEDGSNYEVEPYGIRTFRQRIYMICRPIGTNSLRTFSLDRIIEAVVMEETTFKVEEHFSLKEYFADSYGIMADPSVEVESIRLKAYGLRSNYLEDLPLHSSQRVIERKDGWTSFYLRLRPTYDLLHELFGFGSEIEIISPQWIADELKLWARELLERYEKKE